MAEPAVTVTNLHKNFVLPQHRNTSLKQSFVNLGHRNTKHTQHVLDGISFEVNQGDFFGIVGRNGSGKSTLLKILAGVYTPTAGAAQLNGSLTPFIELGVGFNPELSGRDNVFLNGALLGFNRKEMAAMYDEIVAFAELQEFMDQKLKNYSSGMQVRLAFSIAIKAHNDILIFDEVLAVGDEAFQRKCLDVFEQHKSNKQTVILVTHDMETVKRFCSRALLLHEGKILEIGDPRAVARKYSELNQEEIDRQSLHSHHDDAEFLQATLCNQQLKQQNSFEVGERMLVKVSWAGLDPKQIESIGINIFKRSGEHVTGINSRFGSLAKDWKAKGEINLAFDLDITPGRYFVLIEAFQEEGKTIDAMLHGPEFTVKSSDIKWSGLVDLPHSWIEKA